MLSVGPLLISSDISNRPLVLCNLGGVDVHALIDTGSMKSFITQHVFEILLPQPVLAQTTHKCVGITGQPLDIAGTTQLDMSYPCISPLSYPGTFLVSSTLFQPLECVLGWDFITSNGLQLSSTGDGSYFLLGKHGFTPLNPFEPSGLLSHPVDSKCLDITSTDSPPCSQCLLVQSVTRGPVTVTSQQHICIPGRSEVLVNCYIPKRSKEQLGMITPVISSEVPFSLLAAYSVCQAQGKSKVVRLMNTSNVNIEFQAGQQVSEFCPLVETYDPQLFHYSGNQVAALLLRLTHVFLTRGKTPFFKHYYSILMCLMTTLVILL